MERNIGTLMWYKTICYELPLFRWIFFVILKGLGPLNVKKMFFSDSIRFF
jgi:hypothetical protein